MTDQQRIVALEKRISNFEECDLAWRDARTEAIDAVMRWADGDRYARDDWRAAIERMTRARTVRSAAKDALQGLLTEYGVPVEQSS